MTKTNDRAITVAKDRRDVLSADELRRQHELDLLIVTQYDDVLFTPDMSIEDLLDDDLELPILLDHQLAWERDVERKRRAGRRRSSIL